MNKLRNKFKTVQRGFIMPERIAEQCEQITDDFSVKFAEWLEINSQQREYHPMASMSKTELLQIFKEKYYDKI